MNRNKRLMESFLDISGRLLNVAVNGARKSAPRIDERWEAFVKNVSIVVDLEQLKTSCSSCNLRELCLPGGITAEELERLDTLVKRQGPFQHGDYLFRAGEALRSLYAVRSGVFKLFATAEDGTEQVLGFYLPGEILGFDAIGHETHNCSAIALETSVVCSIPFKQLTEISRHIQGLQERLLRLMSHEISTDNQLLLTIGNRNAEERIATFLLSLSNRFHRLGYSASEFKLSMSRQDIGNYLGLTIETVSRILGRLQRKGLITLDRKHVQLNSIPALDKICSRVEAILGTGSTA